MTMTMRDFPTEAVAGPWPMLVPTPSDKTYQAIVETPEQFARRTRIVPEKPPQANILVAMLKGALLGSMVFSLFWGIDSYVSFWFFDWHWVFTLAGAALLVFLFGARRTVLLIIGILFLMIIPELIMQRGTLFLGGLFLGGGMLVRGFIEYLPRNAI